MQLCTDTIRFQTGPSTKVTIAMGERVPDALAALVPDDQQDRLAPLDDDVQDVEAAPDSDPAPVAEPPTKRRRKSD